MFVVSSLVRRRFLGLTEKKFRKISGIFVLENSLYEQLDITTIVTDNDFFADVHV